MSETQKPSSPDCHDADLGRRGFIGSGLSSLLAVGALGSVPAAVTAQQAQPWHRVPRAVVYSAAQMTQSSALANITSLSFSVAANTSYLFEFMIFGTGAAAGVTFGLIGPPGPTALNVSAFGMLNSNNSFNSAIANSYANFGQGFLAGISGWVQIKGSLLNGALPGTVQLQFASATNGQMNWINQGSYLVLG